MVEYVVKVHEATYAPNSHLTVIIIQNPKPSIVQIFDESGFSASVIQIVTVTDLHIQLNFNCYHLQVVEKAFKHPKTEIRKATYQAWMTLMDNFAEDQSILCSPKRIKLITRPLIVSFSWTTAGAQIPSTLRWLVVD